jgi:hypothetical protein
MVIIFLDFDGVLHPYASWPFTEEARRSHFQHLPRFETVLRDFPNVRVVIASDWRRHNSIDELRRNFSGDVQSRIIGVTALDRESIDAVGHRHLLAERYLADNGLPETAWIAVDDTEENYFPSSPLVLCVDYFGEPQETLLRSMLGHLQFRAQRRSSHVLCLTKVSRRATWAVSVQNAARSFDRSLEDCFRELTSIEPELAQSLVEVFGSMTGAMKWMSRPLLGSSESPAELLGRGCSEEIRDLLHRLEHGVL